jgi:N-acetylmuramoyl-L-alanine amidase
MKYLVVLDAGHGLDTPGKRTPLFDDGSFMKENEFNRSVVRKIDSMLEKNENIDVIFTVTEKRDVSLDERVRRANDAFAKFKNIYDDIVLVSIHSNAYGDGSVFNGANGTSSHYYPANIEDKSFASVIHKNLTKETSPSSDRGIIGSDFQIIRESKMKAVLCENLFMTNFENAKLLRNDEFRDKTAKGIVDGLLEYFKIDGNEEKSDVEYWSTINGTHQLRGPVKDFAVKIVNAGNTKITEKYCVNGTFFWFEDETRTKTYPTSITVKDGTIIQNTSNHFSSFNCPQSVFIVYYDGRVEMKKIKFAEELDYKNIKAAIGGVGLKDDTNPDFRYDPSSEGFKKGYSLQTGEYVDYTDVLRKTNKTVIGYNKSEDKIYMMVRNNIAHKSILGYDLLKLVNDCGYEIAISVDGGGSTFMRNGEGTVLEGDGRKINNIIGFGL